MKRASGGWFLYDFENNGTEVRKNGYFILEYMEDRDPRISV